MSLLLLFNQPAAGGGNASGTFSAIALSAALAAATGGGEASGAPPAIALVPATATAAAGAATSGSLSTITLSAATASADGGGGSGGAASGLFWTIVLSPPNGSADWHIVRPPRLGYPRRVIVPAAVFVRIPRRR